MSLPSEELYALEHTREFLRSLLKRNLTQIRKDAKSIRDEAGSCLKHYPWKYHLDKMYQRRIENEIGN